MLKLFFGCHLAYFGDELLKRELFLNGLLSISFARCVLLEKNQPIDLFLVALGRAPVKDVLFSGKDLPEGFLRLFLHGATILKRVDVLGSVEVPLEFGPNLVEHDPKVSLPLADGFDALEGP